MPRKRPPSDPPVDQPEKTNVTPITKATGKRTRRPNPKKKTAEDSSPALPPWKPLVHSVDRLTKDHVASFVNYLNQAMGWTEAAHLAGVNPGSASSWRQTVKDFSEDVDAAGLPKIVWEFVQRGETAQIECEHAMVLTILAHSARDWKAAMALLERKVPDRWAKKPVDVNLQVSGEVVYGMSDRDLKKMALWMEASTHGIRNAKGDVIITPERLLKEHKLPAPIRAMLAAQELAKEGVIDVESWERERLDDGDKT